MIFIAKTISFVKGKGSLNHNNRKFIANNIDSDRTPWNITYITQPLEEAYWLQFGPAIEEYNAKQKRSDRKIDNYLTKIKNSRNREKQFYEIVVQVGKKSDTGVLDENGNLSVEAEEAKKVLDEYARSFRKRNPNLYLFNAVLHMDEATPHLHLDYIPIAHGYKSGLGTRNSLTKALQEMGIESALGKTDTETMHWQAREREFITSLCKDRGIEIEIVGEERDDYSIPEYKAAMRAKEEAEAELEILSQEKAEMENIIVSSEGLLSEKQEMIDEKNETLEDINNRIAEAEEKRRSEEKRIDKILGADEAVRKEVAEIRKEASPVILKFPRGPESVKIPRTTFDNLLDKYQAVGTLQKLNEDYSKTIESKNSLIKKLKEQVSELKKQVENHNVFLKARGLLEEFKEFFRPKSLSERLKEEQNKLRERERQSIGMPKKHKNHDYEI